MRRSGYDLTRILTDNPELRWLGIAFAFCYAADHPERYAEFLAADGSLVGPGFTEAEAAGLPDELRRTGVVLAVGATAPAPG
jgi:pimeloyl-ACP methyl ester carboxylesterase